MKQSGLRDTIKSLGLVFGDIGTSPIYTLTVIFIILKATPENIIGVISLIIWSLIILVFVEYIFLAMSLDVHGEGGTLILKRIIDDVIRSKKTKAIFAIVAFTGVSLLLGDGVITPSISILSAVEGINLIPGIHEISQSVIIIIAIAITIGLFIFQPLGTDRVASAFGPIMVIWFFALAISGVWSISYQPEILKAINPYYAFQFLYHNGIAGFFILSQVILCATGAEALYADMGHLGKKPIIRTWRFVFLAVTLNYMGQGALLLKHPESKNLLFEMIRSQSNLLYIPFLFLTILATIIASQALISGVFSVVYQGISSGVFPRMKVDFTSNKLKSQIYLGAVNFTLMIAVIFMLILFKRSDNLAVAYGLAVTGTMLTTGIMMICIFFVRKNRIKWMFAVLVTLVDAAFFTANIIKLPHGGYWSLILASFPFMLIMIWVFGQKRIYEKLRAVDLDIFLPSFQQIYKLNRNIAGTALFFVGSPKRIPPYVIHGILRSSIIYERNVLLSIFRSDYPYGIEIIHDEALEKGLESFIIKAGYKENVDIEKILKAVEIDPKVIFYGVEDIYTKNPVWRVFSLIKRISPSFVKFYHIPGAKLHGILSRIEI